jgi:hypothetical protein
MANAAIDLAAVGFKLGLAGTSRPNAAAKLRHFRAPTGEPRQHVFELRQLNLQLAFARARMRSKYVENKLGAVDHARVHNIFDVSLLRGGKVVIEKNEIRRTGRCGAGDFLQLAGTYQRSRIWAVAALQSLADDLRTGADGQVAEFS